MRVSTSLMYDQAISSFATQQKRIFESQQQISTGLRITDPHQDPIAAVNIDRLEGMESRMDSYQNNIGTLTERLALEDSSMSDMSNLYHRLQELTIQSGNTTLPKEGRVALAGEMSEILQNLASFANTKNSQGHYAFSGAEGDQQPVEIFLASGMVGAHIAGDNTARSLDIADGRKMEIGGNIASDFLRVDSDNALRTRAALSNNGSANALSAFVSNPTVFTGQEFSINFDSTNTYDVVADDGTVLLADQDYRPGEAINYGGVRTAINGQPAIGDSFSIEGASSKDAFTVANQLIGVLRSGSDEQVSAMVDQTCMRAVQKRWSPPTRQTDRRCRCSSLNLHSPDPVSTNGRARFILTVTVQHHKNDAPVDTVLCGYR